MLISDISMCFSGRRSNPGIRGYFFSFLAYQTFFAHSVFLNEHSVGDILLPWLFSSDSFSTLNFFNSILGLSQRYSPNVDVLQLHCSLCFSLHSLFV